jgi:hypothetical protein
MVHVNTEAYILHGVHERLATVSLEQQDRGPRIPRVKDGQERGGDELVTGSERVTKVGGG